MAKTTSTFYHQAPTHIRALVEGALGPQPQQLSWLHKPRAANDRRWLEHVASGSVVVLSSATAKNRQDIKSAGAYWITPDDWSLPTGGGKASDLSGARRFLLSQLNSTYREATRKICAVLTQHPAYGFLKVADVIAILREDPSPHSKDTLHRAMQRLFEAGVVVRAARGNLQVANRSLALALAGD